MRYRKAGEGQEGEVKVSLMQNMKVKVNGKRVSLPYIKLSSGLSIMKDGYRVFLRTSEGRTRKRRLHPEKTHKKGLLTFEFTYMSVAMHLRRIKGPLFKLT